jgi:hypothetical protein
VNILNANCKLSVFRCYFKNPIFSKPISLMGWGYRSLFRVIVSILILSNVLLAWQHFCTCKITRMLKWSTISTLFGKKVYVNTPILRWWQVFLWHKNHWILSNHIFLVWLHQESVVDPEMCIIYNYTKCNYPIIPIFSHIS